MCAKEQTDFVFLISSHRLFLLADLLQLPYLSLPAEQTNHNSVCGGSICTCSNTPSIVLSEVRELYLVAWCDIIHSDFEPLLHKMREW